MHLNILYLEQLDHTKYILMLMTEKIKLYATKNYFDICTQL